MLDFGQLPQQIALARVEFSGHFDVRMDEQTSDSSATVRVGQALALHFKNVARLGAGRYFQFQIGRAHV